VITVLFVVATLFLAPVARAQEPYFPPEGDAWERRTPEQVGLDPQSVHDALALVQAGESEVPIDLLDNHRRTFGREPHGQAIGPFRDRGPASGMIVRRGYIVAEWGDPHRVDLTFSVTKSFLSTAVGLAYDRGLIRDLDAPVRHDVPPILALAGPPFGTDSFDRLQPFESEHNRRITWDHLLRQTSDWQGTLWGKPDWADRPQADPERWRRRPRDQPGTVFRYNDVRVNLLALAALNLWRRPLPQVLRDQVMDPIGASRTWRWYGYANSWIVLDGVLVQSVSGGAHWGGGMWISSRDLARFGYLTLRRGKWGERQILSEAWIRMATTPGVNRDYGFMNYFLNTGRRGLPNATEEAFWHLGAGMNIVYVDPVNDLVVVARWIRDLPALDRVIGRLLEGGLPVRHRSR
jgi:CubicO group peptidase (beta-lactamase class C family)